MELKLKACPFCGGKKMLNSGGMDMDGCYDQILCAKCGARGPEQRGKSRMTDRELWNRRAPATQGGKP